MISHRHGFAAMLLWCVAGAVAGADDPEADYARARAAFQAGDTAIAADVFAALAARHPDNADYLLGHGQALLATGHPAAAVDVLEQALALAPDYADVALVLANARRALVALEAADVADPALVQAGLVADLQQPPGPGPVTVTWGVESTRTERDDNWRDVVAGAEYAWSRRTRLGARAARSQRFDIKDTLYEVYGSVSLSPRLTLAGRGHYSPTQRVRLHYGGIGEASLVLGHGFVVSAGGGRLYYDNGPSDLATATLEHYFSAFRLAYTATVVQPRGGPWSPAHRWSAGWYYGEDSRFNLSGGFGEETDETVLGAALLRFDTWSAGFHGRHWLTSAFGFDYAAGYNGLESDRGDHLDRTAFYVGIVTRF